MKKSLFPLVAALALPLSQAWAGSYSAKLVVGVASNSPTGSGTVYASDSQKATTGESDVTKDGGSSGASVTLYAYSTPAVGYELVGWSANADGSSIISDSKKSPYGASYKCSTSKNGTETYNRYAVFGEITYDEFQITYLAPVNGSYTVDGTSVGSGGLSSGTKTKIYTPTLVATANSGYAFNGWYLTSDGGQTKDALLSMATTYKGSFSTTQSVMAEFVESVAVTTYDELATALSNKVCIEIPSSATIFIESGKSLSVAASQTLIVNGTLYVIGSFANSGTVKGGGAVVKVTKKITQTGKDDIGTPITTDCVDTSKNKKYYTTAVAAVSATVSGTMSATQKNGAIVMRGGSRIAQCAWPASDTPAVLSCTIDATKAVNHITGFNDTCYYTDTAKGMAAMKNNTTTKMLVLLATKSVSNSNCSSAGLLVKIGTYDKFQANVGVMDLAGSTMTLSPSYIDTYTHILLNGGLSVTKLLYSGTITCIGCSSVSFSSIKPNYASVINIYDCASADIVSKYEDGENIANSFNFYSSSGSTTYSTSDFLPKHGSGDKYRTDGYHIYGGKWSSKPDAKFIASTLSADYAFYQDGGTGPWTLQLKKEKDVVTLSNGTSFESLDEAMASLTTAYTTADAITMTMQKNASLASPVTIPANKTLEVELAGCCITAASGFAVNNGTLVLGDNKGNLSPTGGRILTTSGNLLVNNGTADVTYGYYTGNVVLNGGTFTTHHGWFAGSVTGDKAYANLVGGYFANDVSALLQEGVIRKNGYVGPFPKPSIAKEWVTSSGGYWKFSFKTLPAADLALYNNSSNQKGDYTLENWKRRAEVKSSVTPWADSGFMVDILSSFDRFVASGTVSAQITKPYSMSQDIAGDVSANELYRILSTYMISQGASQKKYTAFLSDSTFQDVVYGFSSTTAANYGTTANLRIDLCNGTDTSVNSVQALMSEYVVFGAGKTNQAMIQPASGQATFYATVSNAVAACAKGGTVKLCNDITSEDPIPVAKTCTLDINGMNCAGEIVAGSGYQITAVTNATVGVESYLDKNHRTYTFGPVSYAITYELNGGTNPPDNPATYTIEDAVTLKAPTRAGHFFTGWKDSDGTIPAGSTGVKTFIATWKKSAVFYVK